MRKAKRTEKKRPRGKETWDPNRITFWEGQPHLKATMKKVGLNPDVQVLTSKDRVAQKISKLLETANVPPGFHKWQLPFSLYQPSNTYITVGDPGARVKTHAHKDGAGYRVIIEGSIHFRGNELTAGDWMYVPKGRPYAYEVGPRGVTLMASYEC